MLSLYISGNGIKKCRILTDYSYMIGASKALDSQRNINDAKKLNSIAKLYAQEFADYIFSINDTFVKNKIFTEDNLSLYHLSDLSCKRSELFETYSTFCNAILLKNLIAEKKIKEVFFDCCNVSLIEYLVGIYPNIDFQIISHQKKSKKINFIFIKNILFFLKILLSRIIENCIFSNKEIKKKQSYFLTRYPSHLDEDFNEDKFGSLINKSDKLLINIHTDGFHQNITVVGYIKLLAKLRRCKDKDYVVLDRFVTYKDIFKYFYVGFKYSAKLNVLKSNKFIFKDVDLTNLIHCEIELSKLRVSRLLLIGSAFKHFCSYAQPSKLHYYLHEYSYGKTFTYISKRFFSEMGLYAYQHGPSSNRKLIYFSGKNELNNEADGINSFFMPDKVFAEEEFSLKLYKDAGYKNVILMKKIHRLSYLKNINQKQREKFILITPGLNDGALLLEYLISDILLNTTEKFFFKPHPRANNSYLNNYRNVKNLTISDEQIYSLLASSKKVYVSYSSIGIEAKILGIEVELIEIPGRINESPLIDEDFLSCIKDIKY